MTRSEIYDTLYSEFILSVCTCGRCFLPIVYSNSLPQQPNPIEFMTSNFNTECISTSKANLLSFLTCVQDISGGLKFPFT